MIDLMPQEILMSLTACVSELFVITCTFPGWILYFNQKYLMAAIIWHRNPWVLMAIQLLLWNGIVIELIFGSWQKTRLWPEWKVLILVKKNWRLLLWKNIYFFKYYEWNKDEKDIKKIPKDICRKNKTKRNDIKICLKK